MIKVKLSLAHLRYYEINQGVIMKNLIYLILLSLTLISCSHQARHPHQVEKAKDISTLKGLKRYGPITFAPQPDKASIQALRSQGYAIVINLRHPSEFKKFNEKQVVEANKMAYYNIPLFDKQKNFSTSAIQEVHKVIQENHNKKIFLHCSSGNRAAAWLGAHLHLDHGLSIAKSIEVAKEVGMTKPKLETKLRSFLK